MTTQEEAFWFADALNNAGDFNSSISCIKKLISEDYVFHKYDLEIIFTAFKNKINSITCTVDTLDDNICAIKKEKKEGNEITQQTNKKKIIQLKEYKWKIVKECKSYCRDILNIIDNVVYPQIVRMLNKNREKRVICMLFKAGIVYKSHLYDTLIAEKNDGFLMAKNIYEATLSEFDKYFNLDVSGEQMDLFDLYDSIVLSYSVFLHDRMNMTKQAIEIAERAIMISGEFWDLLYQKYDCIYNQKTLVLSVLRDKCAIWKEELENGTDYIET